MVVKDLLYAVVSADPPNVEELRFHAAPTASKVSPLYWGIKVKGRRTK